MAQLPASELLPSQQKRNDLIEVFKLINNKHPHPKPTHIPDTILYDGFSQFFLLASKRNQRPFPPFQQRPTTTQPFGSVTDLDSKLHSKVLIQFPPWRRSRRRIRHVKKNGDSQKSIPKKNRSNDIYISFMFKGKKRCTCLFLFGKIKWLQMDLFFPFPTHPGTKNTLLNMVGTKKSACNLKQFKNKWPLSTTIYSTVHLRFHDLL